MEILDVGSDQLRTEAREHTGAIIPCPKFAGGDIEECTDVTSKALWRAIIEMIGDVGDGKAGILEQPRSSYEARHSEIPLGSRHPCSKESAHEGACRYVEVTRKETHVPEPW